MTRLLLIEADETYHRLLTDRLQRDQYKVSVQKNEFDAQNELILETFDLILLTANRELSEESFFRFLKGAPRLSWLPVLVLIQNPILEDKEKYYSFGASEVLERNIDYEELRLRIENELKKSINLEDMAFRDTLTKAYNRRYYEHQVILEVQRSSQLSRPVSLAMIDADRFKSINDTYGHHVGDLVLIGLAQAFEKSLIPPELVARFGGEEFILILPGSDGETAYRKVMDILQILRDNPVAQHDGEQRYVTFSAGVCEYHSSLTIEQWFHLTDEAAYEAKKNGRNRVVLTNHLDLLQPADETIQNILIVDSLETGSDLLNELGKPYNVVRVPIDIDLTAILTETEFSYCFIYLQQDDQRMLAQLKQTIHYHKETKFIAMLNKKEKKAMLDCLTLGVHHIMYYPEEIVDLEITFTHL